MDTMHEIKTAFLFTNCKAPVPSIKNITYVLLAFHFLHKSKIAKQKSTVHFWNAAKQKGKLFC